GRVPPVAEDADPTAPIADRLDRPQDPLQGPPAEPVVADVHHAELFAAQVQRFLPRRTVPVEEKWPHVGPQRVERRLVDLVREALAHLHPAPALRFALVVEVTLDSDRVVVLAVAVDPDPAAPWHPARQPPQVHGVAGLEAG